MIVHDLDYTDHFSNMPASENAVNNFRHLTSDNQLEDGGKMHVANLETFSWQSA